MQGKLVGFVNYDTFEASDLAIEKMNETFFANKVIRVEYKFKNGISGERHGSKAERFLAQNKRLTI